MSTITTTSKKKFHTLDQKRLAIDVVTCDGRVTPMLFQEFSFLDEQLKNDVNRYCLDRGWIPLSNYDPALKSWIFHSIMFGDRIWKKPIAEKYVPISEYRGGCEAKLERDFSAYLRSAGLDVRTQVRCAAGIADIVTDNEIYELKYKLD